MKKILFLTIVLLLSILLSSCKYISSYKAIALVRTQTSHSCKVSFSSLDGTLVFKLKKTDSKADGNIRYSLKVTNGEIKLYYDIYGTKEQLAYVKAGESIDDFGGYIEGGKVVYIIIEAIKGTEGEVFVELDY